MLREVIRRRGFLPRPEGNPPLYFIGAGLETRRNESYKWNGNAREGEGLLLCQFTLSGCGAIRIGSGKSIALPCGKLFVAWIPSDHAYFFSRRLAREWRFVWAMLQGSAARGYWEMFAAEAAVILEMESTCPAIRLLRALVEGGNHTAVTLTHARDASRLVHDLLRIRFPGVPASSSSAGLPRAPASLDAGVSKGGWADHAGLSRFQLYRMVRKQCGQSPSQWLIRRRLEQACELLRSSSAPVAEVARSSGWQDPNFFARTFRAHTGHSPTEWRRQFGETETCSAAVAL